MTKKIFRKRSWVFTTGMAFVIFWSVVMGFLNFGVLYIFCIPILGLLVGIIFVWVAKVSLKKKLFVTAAPVLIVPSGFFLFYLLLPKAELETFLIPTDFRQQLVVVFDEPCGQTPTYENGRTIYQIPDNGILITKIPRTMGVIDRKFYLVEEDGNRMEIPEFHWDNFEKEGADWHWRFSRTQPTTDSVGVFWAYRNDFSFIISDYAWWESSSREVKDALHNVFQTKLDLLLKQCRQSE